MQSSNILFLDSDKIANGRYTLDNRISGVYKLLSFVCTNNIYNVNENNNKIYINENGVELVATLTNGFNDINDLKNNISTCLNAVCDGTITVSVDLTSNKYTVSNDTHDFYFSFGSNTSNSARKLLGFNGSDGTDGSSQTSDNPADLNPDKNVFLTITQDNDRIIRGIDFFDCSFLLNGLGGFGELFRYVDVDNFHQQVKFKDTNVLNVSFHNENNESISLNSDYQLILKKVL